MRTSSETDNLEDLERLVGVIERGSRDQFGGRYHVKPLIDVEILAGWADPDEIAHEAEIERPYRNEFPRADSVLEESEGQMDFRDLIIDGYECDCKGDSVCIHCCTTFDFQALPPEVRKIAQPANRRRDSHGFSVFDIILPLATAASIGVIVHDH